MWESLKGSPWPPILNGRAPEAENEMLVGPETLRVLGVEVGETVTVVFGNEENTQGTAIDMTMFPDGLPDEFGVTTEWFTSAEPSEVTQADSASDVLVLSMIALALGVLAAVGNNLIGFVRERRNAFAVLKAIGFTPTQIRTTVLWQSGSVIALLPAFQARRAASATELRSE